MIDGSCYRLRILQVDNLFNTLELIIIFFLNLLFKKGNRIIMGLVSLVLLSVLEFLLFIMF